MPDQLSPLEQRVRDAFRDEARSLPFTVSAGRVQARFDHRRREERSRRVAFAGAAAVLAIVATGGFAVLSTHRVDVATSPSLPAPTAVSSPAPNLTPSPTPTPGASATPAPSRTVPLPTGTLQIRVNLPKTGVFSVPVSCTWSDTATIDSVTIAPTVVGLFGEQVSPSFDGSASGGTDFVIHRFGRGQNYVDGGVLVQNTRTGVLSGMVTLTLDGAGSAEPSPFDGIGSTLEAGYTLDCGQPPVGTPLPSLDPNGEVTRGSATLALTAPASDPVSFLVECDWSSAQHVPYYMFPQNPTLLGESVGLELGQNHDGVQFMLTRAELAWYTARTGTLVATGFGRPTGSVTFSGLAPDPETYPIGQPLPSPLAPFIAPLGGLTAAASLDGTLSWDCGAAPGGVPAVEPTPEPTASLAPIPTPPAPTLALAGASASVTGEPGCGNSWTDAKGLFIGGISSCGPILFFVPTSTLDAKAGDTLDLAFGAFALSETTLTAATVAEVQRWRGGVPDTLITLPVEQVSGAHLRFKVPAAGDWVIKVVVTGTKSSGEKIVGTWLFRVHVTR